MTLDKKTLPEYGLLLKESKFFSLKRQKQIWQSFFPLKVLYFFSYRTEFFSFKNNAKNLDLSLRMDLDLWDCLGSIKLVF